MNNTNMNHLTLQSVQVIIVVIKNDKMVFKILQNVLYLTIKWVIKINITTINLVFLMNHLFLKFIHFIKV